MKIQENIIDNMKVIQIYLTEDEKSDLEVQQKIEKLKEKNKVVLFVSGELETEKVLSNMVKIMRNQ